MVGRLETAALKRTHCRVQTAGGRGGGCRVTRGQSRRCVTPEGWDVDGGGRGFKREGTRVYLRLIHADDVWRKPSQYCKVTILQLKLKL